MKIAKLGTLFVATVSVFAAAISVYIFFSGETHFFEKKFKGEEYIYSPTIGAEFFQDGIKKEMFASKTIWKGRSGVVVIDVSLERAPFTIIIPKSKDAKLIRLVTSTSESIFDKLRINENIHSMEYFVSGSGYAQYNFSPNLVLSGKGHHYLTEDRLRVIDDAYNIDISKIYEKYEKKDYHISHWKRPIYMIIFYDKNGNSIIDKDINESKELELFKLQF